MAIYPEEGTVFSDNPFFILDAEWVSDTEREGAERFEAFVQEPANQERVLEYGFRPGNPDVAVGSPITPENGVDPTEPQTLLEVPDPPVMIELLERWEDQRKPARVELLLDISGSMGDPAGEEAGPTKLDLAVEAAVNAIDQFGPRDVVGLSIFSTGIGSPGNPRCGRARPSQDHGRGPAPRHGRRPRRPRPDERNTLVHRNPTGSTRTRSRPTTRRSINAVVLLSDGVNEDGDNMDDDAQLEELLGTLEEGGEGERAEPVRVFPISYGADADLPTLQLIAEASDAALYNATDATTIERVLTSVISNF